VGITVLGPPKAYTIEFLWPYSIIVLASIAAGLQKWLQEQPLPTLSSELDEILRIFIPLATPDKVTAIKILNTIANAGIQTNAPTAPPN
jgi:hypothetical protein